MITIITGLPGNGKTLYGINYIKAYAEKENRDVYYSGIKDLLLPWTEIKPEDWPTLPAGAIIVIDEAQFVFPKKPNGATLPDYYQKLAIHRHSGYDIFIITQHPSLVDNFVRQLCGRHLHVIRKFGLQRANVWEWAAANTSPEKASSHKSAVLHKFGYPKEVYGYYKSAEVHTVKRSIPAKLILAILFVLAVPAFGYYVLDRFQAKAKPASSEASGSNVSSGSISAAPAVSGKAHYQDAMEDAKQYVYERTARIEGLQHTAPVYDEITRPTVAPVPAVCVANRQRCQCYSQQGTKMSLTYNQCLDIAHNGYFQEFDPNGSNQKMQQTARVLNAQERLPISNASTRDVMPQNSASSVVSIASTPAPSRLMP